MNLIKKLLEGLSGATTSAEEVAGDILLLEFKIVTGCMLGQPGGEWYLVDTGLENSATFIIETAEERFGKDRPPQAILLTHGHFDHVGSVLALADRWNVPVYAHAMEMPYLTGKKDYPQGDPTVDEGLVAKMSPAFPHHGIDLGHRVVAFPDDGSIPGLAEWRVIPTPGHTPGHVSFYRERERILLAGDALTTTKQESFTSVLTQREEVKGPPAYLTTDWQAAEESVRRLRVLDPDLVVPSHGQPMRGETLERHLRMLAEHFVEVTVPEEGRFVERRGDDME